MELTNSMVRAAVKQAVELGLLARNGAQNEYDWNLIKQVLGAALTVGPRTQEEPAPSEREALEAW